MTGCECEAGGVLTDCDGLHGNHQVDGSDDGRSSLKSPAHHRLIGQKHPAHHLPRLVVYCQNLQTIISLLDNRLIIIKQLITFQSRDLY